MLEESKKNQPNFDPTAPDYLELEKKFEQILLNINDNSVNEAELMVL